MSFISYFLQGFPRSRGSQFHLQDIPTTALERRGIEDLDHRKERRQMVNSLVRNMGFDFFN